MNARGLVPGSRETGTTAITYLFFDPTKTDLDDQDELAPATRDKYVAPTTTRSSASPAPSRRGWRSGGQIAEGLPWVTAATIAVIALILGIHFRSPVAPLVTLVAAGDRLSRLAPRPSALVGSELDVTIPRDAEPVLVVLLLGVVTDYAVFFLHGIRERLAPARTGCEAAEGATAEYLPIVVTAGPHRRRRHARRSSPGSSTSSAPSGRAWRSRWRSACSSPSRSCRPLAILGAGGVLAVAPRGGAAARPGRAASRGSPRRAPSRS